MGGQGVLSVSFGVVRVPLHDIYYLEFERLRMGFGIVVSKTKPKVHFTRWKWGRTDVSINAEARKKAAETA